MAVSKQFYTGTVYNLVQRSSYMNLTFIVNERNKIIPNATTKDAVPMLM